MKHPAPQPRIQVCSQSGRSGKVSGLVIAGGSVVFLVIMLVLLVYTPPKDTPSSSTTKTDTSSSQTDEFEGGDSTADPEENALVIPRRTSP